MTDSGLRILNFLISVFKGVGSVAWQSDLGGWPQNFICKFFGFVWRWSAGPTIFEPQTFGEPPSVVNQMNDDYFDLQVVLTIVSWACVGHHELDFQYKSWVVRGKWSVVSPWSEVSPRSEVLKLVNSINFEWTEIFQFRLNRWSDDLAMGLSRFGSCSYRSESVRAVAAFPIMLWWSTVTSAMETVHSPQVLCRREGAALLAVLLKFEF